MTGILRLAITAVAHAAVLVSGCGVKNPIYCDEETPCTEDPLRPFCDLHGEYQASEGKANTCIPVPFDGALPPDGGDGLDGAGESFQVTVTVEGPGSGRVVSQPAGISCPGTCAALFPRGTTIGLVAEPDPDSSFFEWAGDCSSRGTCVLVLDGDKTVGASFGPGGEPLLVENMGMVFGYAVAAAADGDILVGGCSGGGATGRCFTTQHQLSFDGFVTKRSLQDGSERWSKRLGEPVGNDGVFAIAVDADGAVFVGGKFQNSLTIDEVTLTGGTSSSFVAKLSPEDGSVIWARAVGGNFVEAVAIGASGDVYVTGSFVETTDFGPREIAPAGGTDVFVLRLAADTGQAMWAERVGGSGGDTAWGIAVDAGENVYVTGSFEGTATIAGKSHTSSGGKDMYLARFGSQGAGQWSVAIGGVNLDEGRGVSVDTSGDVVVAGVFSGTIRVDATVLESTGGSQDILVARFSPAGSPRWVVRHGGTGVEDARGIASGPDSEVAVVGAFEGTASFGGPDLTSGGQDVFVARYSAEGAYRWSRRFGGTLADEATSVALGDGGRGYVTGRVAGVADFGSLVLDKVGAFGLVLGP